MDIDWDNPMIYIWALVFAGIVTIFVWKPLFGVGDGEGISTGLKVIISVLSFPVCLFMTGWFAGMGD